ncbi:hypothetical protein KMZ93_11365 [Bradyrhizobium sediminis]|uniref:Uncharacterized protein n=1 Tax=Bradyrhizobium sediminis TaxID=2840469 RepID=A0A975RZN9_9BRAD|nr:hypothetical protein [Bradyrhizobium sediminis]QWG25423.1 hypothetical protein KMZ93_11365 [Bradyrhizobium sediminis]
MTYITQERIQETGTERAFAGGAAVNNQVYDRSAPKSSVPRAGSVTCVTVTSTGPA